MKKDFIKIVNDSLIGVGTHNKAARKTNVADVLAALSDPSLTTSEVVRDGSNLKIDLTLGVTTDRGFDAKLQEVINGHECTMVKDRNKQGVLHDYLIVDLLKPRP